MGEGVVVEIDQALVLDVLLLLRQSSMQGNLARHGQGTWCNWETKSAVDRA